MNLWADVDRATVPATIGTPVRYNGLGGNPNTMSMLLAFAVPLAVWAFLESGTRGKVAAAAAFVLLDGSIVASGSRGAILGAFVGTLVARPGARQLGGTSLAVAGFAVLVLAANAALTQVPQPADKDPILNPEFGAREPLGPADAQFILPLESEIDFPGLEREREAAPPLRDERPADGVVGRARAGGRAPGRRLRVRHGGASLRRPVLQLHGGARRERVRRDGRCSSGSSVLRSCSRFLA